MRACPCTRTRRVRMRPHACACTYIYASGAYHPREQSSARIVFTCIYIYIYILYIDTNTRIYIYIYMYVCVYVCVYIYVYIYIYISRVSLRTLPCTLTRRRFPIFRPKLSTEKPRPSDPPAPSDRANPLESPSSLLPPRRGPLTRNDGLSPSCATSSRHIRPESNVSRLNGFVSAVRFPPLVPPRIPLRASATVRSSRRRGRNIYYKPRLSSASISSPSRFSRLREQTRLRDRISSEFFLACLVVHTFFTISGEIEDGK